MTCDRDAIISAKTDKRDREVAFQKLIGLDAAKIHKNLTDWMYQAAKPVNYDIQITEAEQRLGELETRETALAGEVKAADEAVAAEGPLEGDTTDLQKSMAAIGAVLAAQSRLKVCQEDDAKAKAELASVKAGLGDVGENPGVDIAEKSAEIATLKEEVQKADALAKAGSELDTAKYNLDRVTAEQSSQAARPHPSDEDLRALQDAISSASAELAVVNAELTSHMKALGSLNGGEKTCPVCGKPLDGDAVAKLKEEYDGLLCRQKALNERLAKARGDHAERKAERDGWEHGRSFYATEVTSAAKVVESAETRLASLPKPTVDRETATSFIEAAQHDIEVQKAYDAKVAGNAKVVKEAEVRASVCSDAVTNATTALDAAVATATALCGAEAAADWSAAQQALQGAVSAYNAKRDRIQALQLAATTAKATHDEVLKTLATLRQTVESLKAQQAKQDVLARRLKVLENVRDWFNYSNGPRVLVNQVLDTVTDDVNRFLGNFTAPFVVTPNHEQLGFFVEFTDGRDRPDDPVGTEALSGGECVQLAVAFRLAVYVMFAGKLGLLSLDEPTAYLDEGNVDRFGILLAKVRDLARNMNTQVLMATHERAVIPHMDSVIDLN